MTLALMPKPLSLFSSPTNITGASPCASVNSAMFDELGDDGLSVPAAYRPEDGSDEKTSEEMIPLRPSRLFFEGVVRSRMPSPGAWISKTSIASSKPQYSFDAVGLNARL